MKELLLTDGRRHDDQKGALALFDFDGTLIPCDSQVLFCHYILKQKPLRRLLMFLFLAATPLALFGKWGERVLKRLFLIYLWRLDKEYVALEAKAFVKDVIVPLLYEDVLKDLKRHQCQGDYCVLVTASPSVYADAIGECLGFDETISTKVLVRDKIPFFPELEPANNKGEAKVRELRKRGLLPERGVRDNAVSYSDSMADLPMLVLTESNVLVNPSAELLGALEGKPEVDVYRLPKLWNSFFGKLGFNIKKMFVI